MYDGAGEFPGREIFESLRVLLSVEHPGCCMPGWYIHKANFVGLGSWLIGSKSQPGKEVSSGILYHGKVTTVNNVLQPQRNDECLQ